MNKKPLDKIANTHNFNKQLFAESAALAQTAKQLIPQRQINIQFFQSNPLLKEKHRRLENVLKETITRFGNFVQIPKNSLGSVVDHSVQIFQGITDLIQTSVKRFKDNKQNPQSELKQVEMIVEKKNERPQDLYNEIKPAAFDFHWQEKNLEFIRCDSVIKQSQRLDGQGLIYVDNEKGLEQMIEQLLMERQIAVDLEHSSKSFEGMTCLIQISSRSKDFIIDVFPIWGKMGLLKKVIEKEEIIKVMHGADMDTKWLQRDFNIHIVNLFDTYKASRVLGFPKFSYAFLLNHYCQVTTDKQYQLADWRQRPLSNEMLHYARLDTHYLLQIFDRMRQDLQKAAESANENPLEVIRNVYASSFEVTKIEVELFNYKSKELYVNLKRDFNQKHFGIVERVFELIDSIARQADISFDDLVSKKALVQIVSRIKDLLIEKNSLNVRIKIDRLMNIIRGYHHQHLQQVKQLLLLLKDQLDKYFIHNSQKEQPKQKEKQKSNANLIIEEEIVHQPMVFKHQIAFKEYQVRTYENKDLNPFSMLKFEPIMAFLAKKYGINQKAEEGDAVEEESEKEQEEAEAEDEEEVEVECKSEENGVIEFKRMNPNVMYTIEEQEQIQDRNKPRKKRKELEYEERLRNKTGNIYDLLEE